MEIIGEAGHSFIVKLSLNELQNLVGPVAYSRRRYNSKSFEVGEVIDIGEMAQQLENMRTIQSKNQNLFYALEGITKALKVLEPDIIKVGGEVGKQYMQPNV